MFPLSLSFLQALSCTIPLLSLKFIVSISLTFALHKYAEEEAERVLEPVVIEDSKQIGLSRHSKTDKHMNSQLHRLCQMLSHC